MEKKRLYIILGVLVFLLVLGGVLVYLRFSEDTWIKDGRGVWVKHGSPLGTPASVLTQLKLISCALNLYNSSAFEEFSSQCLGSCDAFVVDIVHVPRTAEDNLEENICEAFRRGQLKKFIELDKDGNIVRIV